MTWILYAAVALAVIWTVMAAIALSAVFRLLRWIESQALPTRYVDRAQHQEPVPGVQRSVMDPDARRLQEEVALAAAQNRDIDYEGVESYGSLGESVVEDSDSDMSNVEKLRKIQNG